jgi:CheY-like chemotaxis protein
VSGAVLQRMLVIDDEEPILFAAREYFEALGFSVDCATELEEAQALLSHRAVRHRDRGPAGSPASTARKGWRWCATCASAVRRPGSLLLTAYGSAAVEEEARRLGVDGFLQKPKPLPDVAQIVFGPAGKDGMKDLLDTILEPGGLTVHFQPIMELREEGRRLTAWNA